MTVHARRCVRVAGAHRFSCCADVMGPRLSCHCAQEGVEAVLVLAVRSQKGELCRGDKGTDLEIRSHSDVIYDRITQDKQRLQQLLARALVAVVADHLMAKNAGRVGSERQPA